ncbi:aldo/keto reductase [Paracoccus laeviglucosivorans]|uniref:Predicted oxidoreductase n=1 Tax=Paracoccus laeviglucosivorans TaxID=1197861 RepID=A0A521FIR6_9RHOB|nr:aldo/keto reductase [Paracoccus laeviglucosivorans]SMO95999.1 Predicted oxidoreductase [Paracoccus laeviglucosivorans]
MQRMTLGSSGVAVSAVSLGTMTFGNQTDLADAQMQMDMALDAGITFLDTAEMYPVNPVRRETVGRSEEIIGEWLASRGNRDRVEIATKVSGPSDKVRREGFNGAIIRQTIDASLKRLQTDHIDIYQLHWPVRGSYCFRQNWRYDPSKQDRQATLDHMADVLGAIAEAQKAGKIRAFGLSNESAWGTARWIDVAERIGAPRVATIQNEYSLLARLYDTDLAETAVNEDVTLLAYSCLAAGLLTGKYVGGTPPEGSRAAVDLATGGPGDLGGRRSKRAPDAVAAYHALAGQLGLDPIHMAIAFTRQRPFKSIPIIGATSREQLAHLIAGIDLVLSDDALREIDHVNKDHPLPF